MGVSRLTGYIIASRGDDIKVTCSGPDPTGKWTGWITLGPEDRYRPLLDSGPHYNSREEALEEMRKCVEEIRAVVAKELPPVNREMLDASMDALSRGEQGERIQDLIARIFGESNK